MIKTNNNIKKKSTTVKKSTVKKNNKILNIFNKLKEINWKNYLTKVNITYFVLALVDIVLVIYMARKNIVNYVVLLDEEIFVSKTRYLLWGRNYINLIIIAFFYIYTCLITKFFLKRKITKKFLGWLLIGLLGLNVLLFIIFTKKVY